MSWCKLDCTYILIWTGERGGQLAGEFFRVEYLIVGRNEK